MRYPWLRLCHYCHCCFSFSKSFLPFFLFSSYPFILIFFLHRFAAIPFLFPFLYLRTSYLVWFVSHSFVVLPHHDYNITPAIFCFTWSATQFTSPFVRCQSLCLRAISFVKFQSYSFAVLSRQLHLVIAFPAIFSFTWSSKQFASPFVPCQSLCLRAKSFVKSLSFFLIILPCQDHLNILAIFLLHSVL